MKKKIYIEFIFLISLGGITSFSLPPFNYFLINFFTFSSFYIFLVKKFKADRNNFFFFLYGLFFGFGYFVSNIYWISISLTFDENFKFLIPFTIILVPLFLSLFYALAIYLFATLRLKKNLSSFFLFSGIFGFIEFLRGSFFTGFPWNLIAFSFSNHLEILNIMSIIGTYSFNLFCITLFTSPSLLILKMNKQSIIVCTIFFVATFSFYFFGSQKLEKFKNAQIDQNNYKIRIISSNINIDRYYNDVDPILVIKNLIKISSPQKDEKIIFVWPEGIFPGVSQNNLRDYKWLFEEKFSENHLIIVGINSQTHKNQIKRYFNSLSVYDHNLNLLNSYNKVNLVPFGEFLPFEDILKKIGFKTITNNYQSFSRGDKRNIIEINNEGFDFKILPLICYEIIYSGKIFKKDSFDYIINISEDGWFGRSIGPHQHFEHSIYRAIESGKYVMRSANNGISGIVNPLGVVEKQLGLDQIGYIDFIETKKIKPTFFSQYGNKIFVIIILLYIFLIISSNRFENE